MDRTSPQVKVAARGGHAGRHACPGPRRPRACTTRSSRPSASTAPRDGTCGLDPADLADADQFRRYLDRLRADARPGLLRRYYRVPQTSLWLTDGDEFLGHLSIRHALNRRLRYKGGHIGYSVRPSRRRRGYATLMLRLSLPAANQLGIDPALVTCVDTDASRRVG